MYREHSVLTFYFKYEFSSKFLWIFCCCMAVCSELQPFLRNFLTRSHFLLKHLLVPTIQLTHTMSIYSTGCVVLCRFTQCFFRIIISFGQSSSVWQKKNCFHVIVCHIRINIWNFQLFFFSCEKFIKPFNFLTFFLFFKLIAITNWVNFVSLKKLCKANDYCKRLQPTR